VDLEYVCPFIKDPNPSTHLIEKLGDPLQSMNIDQPVVNILLFCKINLILKTYLFSALNCADTGQDKKTEYSSSCRRDSALS
jgi:hypothetical protein